MIVVARNANALGCDSGAWRIWSLSDGHVDMSAEALKEPDGTPHSPTGSSLPAGATVRLSVNCFVLDRSSADRVMIDCGAGTSWDPTMGHLGAAMAEAGIALSSITTLALTHHHGDHVYGLLTPDGRHAFPNLSKIVLAEDAVAPFLGQPDLDQFRPLLAPIKSGDEVANLQALDLPGHAPGHTGYVLNTGDDSIVFCGDVVHVPAAQFARPELTWGYDNDQSVAKATRMKLLQHAAHARTYLAGAHMGRPGVGTVSKDARGYAFEPLA
jgi:glyoxylase-like metal-dependent hydrolase (beta-lactamase superfamily II)